MPIRRPKGGRVSLALSQFPRARGAPTQRRRSARPARRDGALYPLAGRRRARRRIMPELEATAPPIPFWFYRVVAGAAEPWGQLRRRRACNNTVRLRTLLCPREFSRPLTTDSTDHRSDYRGRAYAKATGARQGHPPKPPVGRSGGSGASVAGKARDCVRGGVGEARGARWLSVGAERYTDGRPPRGAAYSCGTCVTDFGRKAASRGSIGRREGIGCGRALHNGNPTSSLPWSATGRMTYREGSKKARNVKTSIGA
jgi:hypothetical protein